MNIDSKRLVRRILLAATVIAGASFSAAVGSPGQPSPSPKPPTPVSPPGDEGSNRGGGSAPTTDGGVAPIGHDAGPSTDGGAPRGNPRDGGIRSY